MKTDEVCDRPVETFGYKNAGAGANPVPRLMNVGGVPTLVQEGQA